MKKTSNKKRKSKKRKKHRIRIASHIVTISAKDTATKAVVGRDPRVPFLDKEGNKVISYHGLPAIMKYQHDGEEEPLLQDVSTNTKIGGAHKRSRPHTPVQFLKGDDTKRWKRNKIPKKKHGRSHLLLLSIS